jgi:LysR family hydrogen peroxide-inducible transcriptional activator
MELNQIKYFTVLARMLHFTRAADTCNVSQPALTRAIQKLEEELGGALFHRERGHTQLTELGRAMLPPLERALAAARDAKTQAEAFRRRETSPLRIGLEYSVPPAVLTPVMASLRRQNQEIELTMRQGSQTDLCERMLDSDVDMALLIEDPDLPERMHRWKLFSERYILICPPDHRFKEQATVSVKDMADECLLLHEDAACPARRFITDVYERHDVKPRRQHFANSFEQIMEMVQASLGVSLAGERLPATTPVLRRHIATEPDQRSIVLATVAGRQLGPTPALFLKMLRARAWSQDVQPTAAAA